ncbi:Phosphate transport system protein phoU homolog [Dermatophilus congolensis]|uniref:Phosphate-specific transport system accessory protein PhoU n=1 Tax=Dermatophilus congolensis TaxID=1863 RepID=A0A239VCZ5_9MICO|nr:phosphate signaling complex protein PhoU [Dermatophilus congolensis]SNV20000.1 Phosphate transport system protein phoU homolog [Dermatophilus congolensis]
MRDAFHEVLDQLTDDLVEMTRLAASSMSRATNALLDADLELTQTVISADEQLDALEKKINLVAVDTLARQQPVATDLRIIVTALRMAASIERMGDLAVHVAKVARLRYPEAAVPPEARASILEMAQVANKLITQVGGIITTKDMDAVNTLDLTDDRLDALHREIYNLITSENAPHDRKTSIDLALLARYYERFGDHAVSVGEQMQYLVTGIIEQRA